MDCDGEGLIQSKKCSTKRFVGTNNIFVLILHKYLQYL